MSVTLETERTCRACGGHNIYVHRQDLLAEQGEEVVKVGEWVVLIVCRDCQEMGLHGD